MYFQSKTQVLPQHVQRNSQTHNKQQDKHSNSRNDLVSQRTVIHAIDAARHSASHRVERRNDKQPRRHHHVVELQFYGVATSCGVRVRRAALYTRRRCECI